MKTILLTLLMALPLLPLSAQTGLQVNDLFDSSYKKRSNAVEVLVKGRELKPYHLTLFRSLTLSDDPKASTNIEQRVKQDARQAVDKEVGLLGDRLYYGFYCLPPVGQTNRYLFYRNSFLKEKEGRGEITLVYMEGNATLEELKRMFR